MPNGVNNTNKFAALADKNDKADNDAAGLGDVVVQEQPPKKPRVPPVVIKNLKRLDVLTLLNSANIVKFNLKLMSIGVKVLFETAADRIKVIALLKQNNAEFFSYANKEDLPIKFVISGLDLYSTTAVFNELHANNFPCTEVKQINIKKERFQQQTNYLVMFKKGTISFADVKKCKALFNTIIYWSPWRRNRNAVTQCYRCQIFGHGEDYCHLPAKCQKCGANHATGVCESAATKCVNCGDLHMASDPTCPKRAEYRNILRNMNSRTYNHNRSLHTQGNNNNFIFNNDSFPSMQRHGRTSNTNNVNNVPPVHNNTGNYAEAAKGGNLFSTNELLSITKDLLTELRGARSKEDQIMAIASIVTKYVYNG